MSRIIGIACVDRNAFYAKKEGGPLAWSHKEGDLDWFKYMTNGGILVVGRNTYEELQKLPPLKNREIWPVGRGFDLKQVEDVLAKFNSEGNGRDLFIAGGGQLWHGFFEYYDDFYLTILKEQYIEDGLKLDLCDFSYCIVDKEKYRIWHVQF